MRLPGIPHEVEQVTDFSQLKTGMVVYAHNCDLCHREWCCALLGNLALFRDEQGLLYAFQCWQPCDDEHSEIDEGCVATGDIYRVVDPVIDAENATVARVTKPRKAVRA